MDSYNRILLKLEAFISRFYRKQLIKGTFIFLFIGGLLLLFIGALEYFLWLNTGFRRALLWAGLVIEGYFLVRYMLFPLLRLLRLRRGLTLKEGSRIIGRHFSDVDDKLFNLLELSENEERTELLLASIDQRSKDLADIPFQRAIKMREAYRYARYALIPIGAYALIWVSGKGMEFMNSYTRVVNYELAYDPPAPFSFQLLSPDLRQREDASFVLKVSTPGEVQPEQVRLILGGSRLIMEDAGSHFEFTFRPPLKDVSFYFEAGGITSRAYSLEVIRVPVIDQFEMTFSYPPYLRLQDEKILGTGNGTVPEGTRVQWAIRTVHADSLFYKDGDTLIGIETFDNTGVFDRRIWNTRPYSVSASNPDIQEYDKLGYRIEVIRDEFPMIRVDMERDSLNQNLAYFAGDITDDYGLEELELVVYPVAAEDQAQRIALPIPSASYHSFYYTFPSGLDLLEDQDYELYFEVTDNDGNKGGKASRSAVFSLKLLNEDAMKEQQLRYSRELLQGLDKSVKEQERIQKELEEFQQSQKEKDEMSFDDTKKLQEFLEKQKRQEQLMEKFSKELSESIDNEEGREEDEFLKERLERQEAEARKNAALMEEIQKILDQLDREALQERMEEAAKSQQGNQRNMQQLLELTKRYYVQEKARQLSRELEKLSEKQNELSDKQADKAINRDEQKRVNEKFADLRSQMQQLEKDNRDLKKPLPWKRDEPKENSISREQQETVDKMEEIKKEDSGQKNLDSSKESIKQKQKNAARKLKELSDSLNQGTSMGGMETLAEDAEMLRQILDNLIVFSLEQEALFQRVQQQGEGPANGSEDVRKQRALRELFEHVDDSLFALSLRQAEISEDINKQITEVYYNIDKGLESFAENNWYRGASYQQYVITATNVLASDLANMLDNMQQSLQPGQGQGEGGDFQLPDIIQSQEDLKQRMEQSGQQGQQMGKQQGDGAGSKEGSQGKDGGNSGQEGDASGSEEGEGSQEGKGNMNSGDGGQEGNSDGAGGLNEEDYSEFFEIYKEQQKIRQQLEQQLEDLIDESDRKLGEQIAREMELFEEEILRNGITERTAERLNRIQQQLMRLENATLQQGERIERESDTNKETFTNPILTRPEAFTRDRNEQEILNRQPLPLQRNYQERVRSYFRSNDTIPFRNRF